jgi:hypothetical protein
VYRTVKKVVRDKAIFAVAEHLAGIGIHFRCFYQDVLEASLNGDLARIDRMSDLSSAALKRIQPGKKLFVAFGLAAGMEAAGEWMEKLSMFFKEHKVLAMEVLEQIHMAKDRQIHERIAQSLTNKLDLFYNWVFR